MNQPEVLKQAFVLGLYRAAREVGIEKTAGFWDIAGKIPFLGKAMPAARFGLFGGGPIGNKFSPMSQKYVRDTLMSGSITGAMNVATGDSETPWYERAAKGWLGGAASGLAFRGGIEGVRGGLSRLGRSGMLNRAAPNFSRRLTQAVDLKNPATSTIGGIIRGAKSGPLGESAKRLGMYALGGVPMVAGSMWAAGKGEEMASHAMGGGLSGPAKATGVAAPAIRSAYRQMSPYRGMYTY